MSGWGLGGDRVTKVELVIGLVSYNSDNPELPTRSLEQIQEKVLP